MKTQTPNILQFQNAYKAAYGTLPVTMMQKNFLRFDAATKINLMAALKAETSKKRAAYKAAQKAA